MTEMSRSGAVVRNKFERMAEIQRAAKTGAKLRNENEDEILLKNGDGLMVTAKLEAERFRFKLRKCASSTDGSLQKKICKLERDGEDGSML